MKRIRCEMCGSSDLIKQDGLYVCQSCGTKYSIEEAKKLFVEGNIDVSGSKVTVENQASVNNLIVLAQNEFYDTKDLKKCNSICDQILAIDGTNCEAWYLKALCSRSKLEFKYLQLYIDYANKCLLNCPNDSKEKYSHQIIDGLFEFLRMYDQVGQTKLRFLVEDLFFTAKNDSFGDRIPGSEYFLEIYEKLEPSVSSLIVSEEEKDNILKQCNTVLLSDVVEIISGAWKKARKDFIQDKKIDSWKEGDMFNTSSILDNRRPGKDELHKVEKMIEFIFTFLKRLESMFYDCTTSQSLIEIVDCLEKSFNVDELNVFISWKNDYDSKYSCFKWSIDGRLSSDCFDLISTTLASLKSKIDIVCEKEENERLKLQKERNDLYWEENAQLKEKLISERETLLLNIAQIDKNIGFVENEIKKIKIEHPFECIEIDNKSNELKLNITECKGKLNKLGIFNLKAKNELKKELQTFEDELVILNGKKEDLYKKYNAEIEALCMPLRAELIEKNDEKSKLNKRIDEINFILNADY